MNKLVTDKDQTAKRHQCQTKDFLSLFELELFVGLLEIFEHSYNMKQVPSTGFCPR